ncbi:MAG TPA: 3-deoxy-manno-octulosonate cytidylyltransferase [Gemmataceae bacterium]|nr:3-deoxy-manno-octulosonate cytidylyltransferase [Gemmataceae bacterium]
MKTIIVIPARYASSRLPGKPLLRQSGKYLIQHVYERASQARKADLVLVATDDSRIAAAVESFGGKAVMTRTDHASGSDRVAEVAGAIDCDIVVNVQGDEPMVDPASLDLLATLLEKNRGCDMATLATPLLSVEDWRNPNCVKVVLDNHGRALYFSRSPIPHVRGGEPRLDKPGLQFLQHLGLYAYRRSFLLELAKLPPHPLEQLEKLEQLRVLGHGKGIQVGIVAESSIGVDTYEDYERFVRLHRQLAPRRAA